jgi:hypothetical protein
MFHISSTRLNAGLDKTDNGTSQNYKEWFDIEKKMV